MGQDRNMNNCELASPIPCPGSLQRIGRCPVSVQLSWQQTIAHFTVRAFSGHRKVSLTALEPCHPDSSSRTILLLVMLGLSHSHSSGFNYLPITSAAHYSRMYSTNLYFNIIYLFRDYYRPIYVLRSSSTQRQSHSVQCNDMMVPRPLGSHTHIFMVNVPPLSFLCANCFSNHVANFNTIMYVRHSFISQ